MIDRLMIGDFIDFSPFRSDFAQQFDLRCGPPLVSSRSVDGWWFRHSPRQQGTSVGSAFASSDGSPLFFSSSKADISCCVPMSDVRIGSRPLSAPYKNQLLSVSTNDCPAWLQSRNGDDAIQDRSRLDWIKGIADAAHCNLPSGSLRADENATRSPRRAAFEETSRLRVS